VLLGEFENMSKALKIEKYSVFKALDKQLGICPIL
jgi:hypothetical protein